MARTNTSVGMGVTVTLLGVLLLATFILSIVFYGQAQRAERELADIEVEASEIILPSERNRDAIQTLQQQASQRRESLVGYLTTSLDRISDDALGRARFPGLEEAQREIEQARGDATESLSALLDTRARRIDRLRSDLEQARAAADNARADLQKKVEELAQERRRHDETIAGLREEIGVYRDGVEAYGSDVQDVIADNNERVERIRSDAAETEAQLRAQLSRLEEEILIQEETINGLREEVAAETLRPVEEYALVDATVVATEPAEQLVFLDIGRSQRVVLGMTFEIYTTAAAIRPTQNGDYPSGKATVEVVRIDPESSACRIIREVRGNPVVEGDVAANAVYDPDKTYTFVVFGNFDPDDDGVATPQGRNPIIGLISGWGGVVVDELSGSTDFLVLGQRPILPPEPPADAPLPIIQDFLQRQRDRQRYDRLFEIARQTGIPVLNENRLYTLTGYSGE